METLVTFFTEIWQWIFGAGGLVSIFLYYRQTRRLKTAEAKSAEIEAVQKVIDSLQKRLDDQEMQIEKLQFRLDGKDSIIQAKDEIIGHLHTEKNILTLKYNQKKGAINCAFECEKARCGGCPVLIELKKIEDDYLSKLNKNENE